MGFGATLETCFLGNEKKAINLKSWRSAPPFRDIILFLDPEVKGLKHGGKYTS